MDDETSHMKKTQSAAEAQVRDDVNNGEILILSNGETVNASGHTQELERNFVSTYL